MSVEFWTVPREWEGETVFIIAGGPSVTQEQVDKLKGRRVIAINSSCYIAPWADVLFFADSRWYKPNKDAVRKFAGRVVSLATIDDSKILRLRKSPVSSKDPFEFQVDAGWLAVRRTSITGAINLSAHFGAIRNVLLGADGKTGDAGRSHHHAPHPWVQKPDCWNEQRKDLEVIAGAIKVRGIQVFNVNHDSAFRMFPFEKLEAFLT